MQEYSGPIGKLETLKYFRELTEPFIELHYTDSDFEDRAVDYILEHLDDRSNNLGSGCPFLLRSAGTFEGMLPYFSEKHQCYVGRTFAGLMDSKCLGINNETTIDQLYQWIDQTKHEGASRFIQAGGGSNLERELFNEVKELLDFNNLDENIAGRSFSHSELVEVLQNYAQRRKVDLSQHSMKFILQRGIEGKLWHIMGHPNYDDILYAEFITNDFDYDYKHSVFPKVGSELHKNYRGPDRNNEFSTMYEEVTRNLNPNFVYLVECVEKKNNQIIPVQATPVFSKRIVKQDFRETMIENGKSEFSFITNFRKESNFSDYEPNRYEGRKLSKREIKRDFLGHFLSEMKGGAFLSHFNIRAYEGIQGIGKISKKLLLEE